jgi:hypothetical protein
MYASSGHVGDTEESVSIFQKDADHPSVTIPITGTVEALFRIMPPVVKLGDIDLGKKKTATVALKRLDGEPLHIERISPPPQVRAVVKPIGKAEVELSLEAYGMQGGTKNSRTLVVGVNHSNPNSVEIPVEFSVSSKFKASPQLVSLGMIEPGSVVTADVVIHGRFTKPLIVSSAPKEFVITLLAEKSKYRLQLKSTPKGESGRIVNSNIVIATGDPEQPKILLPIYAVFK